MAAAVAAASVLTPAPPLPVKTMIRTRYLPYVATGR
jgi:hypothetical protein